MDCHNVQHDTGVGQKTDEDAIGDVSRTKVCKVDDCGAALQQQFTDGLFIICTADASSSRRALDVKDVLRR